MAFVGFDLDETLGYFIGPDPFLHFLEPQKFNKKRASPALDLVLDEAFDTFARCLLSREPSLGILRPGIIEICRKLLDLKNKGVIKAIVIYSNNGNYSSLRLAATMIEIALDVPEGELFCDYIHWNHPMRLGPVNNSARKNNPDDLFWLKDSPVEIKRDKPGVGIKSIKVLKKAFNSCIDTKIDNSDILFFDDRIHPNILNSIGEKNYFMVNRYQKPYNFTILMDCFIHTIHSHGLHRNREYLNYVKDILQKDSTNESITIHTIINKIRDLEIKYKNVLAKQKYEEWIDDTPQILERLDSIYEPKYNNIIYNTNNSVSKRMLNLVNSENIRSQNTNFRGVGGKKKTYKIKRKTSCTRRRR